MTEMRVDVTPKRRVTSADVARAAGVSRATVSYVINGTAALPEPTRERVLAAVDALGYTPSAAARTLRRGRSDLVALILPHFTMGQAVGRLIHTLTNELATMGLSLVTAQQLDDDLWASLTPLAVISLVPLEPDVERLVRASGCSHVLSVNQVTHPATPPSSTDSSIEDVAATRIVEHLISRGHRRLAYAHTVDPSLQWYSHVRGAALTAAIASAGLPPLTTSPVGVRADLADDAVRRWVAAGIDAVIGYNDDVALTVVSAVRRTGYSCPGDVAVLGVDNTPAAATSYPALTSLDPASDSLGALLAARLKESLGRTDVPDIDHASAVRVIVRDST